MAARIAGVTARPKTNRDHTNVRARNVCLRQHLVDQAECIRIIRMPPLSTADASTWPSRASATLRRSEENSSAKIVIEPVCNNK